MPGLHKKRKRTGGAVRHWQMWVAALVLTILLAASPAPADDLVIDGGAVYTVGSNISYANIYLGNLSSGTLNQGGFTNTVTGNLYLGYAPGSSGTYNLSGGDLVITSGVIGNSGTGLFNQSGGNNTAAGNFSLGNGAGGSGTAISLVNVTERAALLRIGRQFSIPLQERPLPTEEDVERIVSERVITLLEARLRGRDRLQAERMQRFLPLARGLSESEDESGLLAMLLDDFYQETFHAPVVPPQEEGGAVPAAGSRPGSRQGRRGGRPRRRGGG